jgi:hypothetical protein
LHRSADTLLLEPEQQTQIAGDIVIPREQVQYLQVVKV